MEIGRDTPLIRTYWKSVNYQWKDGKIVFFAADPEAQAVQGVTCPDRVISSQAVVIHGCKDGSLHKMAQEGFPMPSDSTGLNTPSNSMGLDQSVNNDAQVGTVCDKVSKVVRKPPKKAKKKRVISEAERERRRQSMLKILETKKSNSLKHGMWKTGDDGKLVQIL
jgi:hypothetical protein